MKVVRLAAILIALSFPLLADSSDLAGLWKAKKRFGPDTRGTLLLQRGGSAWTADMAGRIGPVANANGELTLALPDGEGTFQGKLDDKGVIRGRWLRPGTWTFSAMVPASNEIRVVARDAVGNTATAALTLPAHRKAPSRRRSAP